MGELKICFAVTCWKSERKGRILIDSLAAQHFKLKPVNMRQLWRTGHRSHCKRSDELAANHMATH